MFAIILITRDLGSRVKITEISVLAEISVLSVSVLGSFKKHFEVFSEFSQESVSEFHLTMKTSWQTLTKDTASISAF